MSFIGKHICPPDFCLPAYFLLHFLGSILSSAIIILAIIVTLSVLCSLLSSHLCSDCLNKFSAHVHDCLKPLLHTNGLLLCPVCSIVATSNSPLDLHLWCFGLNLFPRLNNFFPSHSALSESLCLCSSDCRHLLMFFTVERNSVTKCVFFLSPSFWSITHALHWFPFLL